MSFLKEKHGLTHGFANLIIHKANATDTGSAVKQNNLIVNQYKGKEHLKAIYDKLLNEIGQLGSDFEVDPKNAYVNLRRKKQICIASTGNQNPVQNWYNTKQTTIIRETGSNYPCKCHVLAQN